jgi:formate hydrogenlyase subunit 4
VTAALLLVPAFGPGISLNRAGDLIAMIFILAFGRFFTALAGLDAGSSFGGMGSSREMFISSLVEPVALLSIFAVSLNCVPPTRRRSLPPAYSGFPRWSRQGRFSPSR